VANTKKRQSRNAVNINITQHLTGVELVSCRLGFKSTMLIVVGLLLILAPCAFVTVTACTFQFVGPVFIYSFQNFPNFSFRG